MFTCEPLQPSLAYPPVLGISRGLPFRWTPPVARRVGWSCVTRRRDLIQKIPRGQQERPRNQGHPFTGNIYSESLPPSVCLFMAPYSFGRLEMLSVLPEEMHRHPSNDATCWWQSETLLPSTVCTLCMSDVEARDARVKRSWPRSSLEGTLASSEPGRRENPASVSVLLCSPLCSERRVR